VKHESQHGPNQRRDQDVTAVVTDFNLNDVPVANNQRDYVSEIKSIQNNWESSQNDIGRIDFGSLSTDDIMLVSQCPRTPSLLHNAGCCGWDLWMDPQKAHNVFMMLILQGKACPIGILDEAHLRLKCEPPLLVFPRDCPDTDEGIKYWQNSDSEWCLVRACLEGGWGRLNIAGWKRSKGFVAKQAAELRLRPIHWTALIADADAEPVDSVLDAATLPTPNEVVVMRGAQFGQPLLNAMRCCGDLPLLTTETSRRRKRRRVKPPHELTHTIPISPEQADSLQEMIASLLQALALPAVVSCHIFIAGRGTLDPGCRIWMSGDSLDDDDLIGFVTAGAFSPTRGRCHGIGIIGAARFLESLLRISRLGKGSAAGRVVVRPDGSRNVETLVRVTSGKRNDNPEIVSNDAAVLSCQGTISLLLE